MRILIVFIAFSVSQMLNGQPFRDSSVCGIELRKPSSIITKFGTNDDLINHDNWETTVLSNDKKQILVMIFLPGGTTNEFSQFKIAYNSKSINSPLVLDESSFVTGKGIALGISENDLKNALGPPRAVKSQNGFRIYEYRISEDLYFGNYYFKNGSLKEIWFGEDYP